MSNSNNDSQKNDSYFNQLTTAVAYFNKVKIDQSKGTIRVSASALYGKSSKPKHDYYSLLVSPQVARDLVQMYEDEINDDNTPVLCSVTLSKGDSKPFEFQEGENKGKLGVTHFGALLEIRRIKINSEVVYQKPIDNVPPKAMENGSDEPVTGDIVDHDDAQASSARTVNS